MKCSFCKKKRKIVVKMNIGYFCKLCFDVGLLLQNFKDKEIERKERLKRFDWHTPVN